MPDSNEIRNEIAAIRNDIQDIRIEEVRTQAKIDSMRQHIEAIKEYQIVLEKHKVSITLFQPIQRLFYGIVSAILLGFLAGLIALVMPGTIPGNTGHLQSPSLSISSENMNDSK